MTSSPDTSHRPDIQAMRALAVSAVVLYHLWPSLLPGGFIGVDVFFVISGYLITGNLIREAEATGSIRVGDFWARRIRRLLPAALTVLAVTSVAVYAFVPANLWPQFLRETVGATLYVENWVLAADSVDYLAAGNAASPVQQFWTLSVEEQFYVITPLLIVALLALTRRSGQDRRYLLLGAISAITLASFAWSLWLTSTSPPSAYFVTTTRAWEFGVGALLVFLTRERGTTIARIAVVAGLVGILGAARLLNGSVPFPGAIAAWPVVAAAAVIWGGLAVGGGWLRLAALRPIQFVGDISYAIYLWHWPLIVLFPYVLGRAPAGPDKVAIVAATLALAAASTRFLENPIRNAAKRPGPARSTRLTAAAGLVGMMVVLALAAGGLRMIETRRVEAQAAAAAVTADHADCLGAIAIVHAGGCRNQIATSVLIPDPANAATDNFNLPECWSGVDVAELHTCSFGPRDAAVRLAAIGDSHNNALLAAYRDLADRNGWRIDVAGHNGCYWTAAVQTKPVRAMVDGCEAWKVNLEHWLDSQPPYRAILVTNARNGYPPEPRAGTDPTTVAVDGLVAAWSSQTRRGTRIIAIRDNPAMRSDVVTCVVRHGQDANQWCSRPATSALGARDPLVEATSRAANARLVDLTDIYCPGDLCLPIIGNVVVYTDKDHVTATFARSLVPILSDRIQAALGT